MPAIGFICPDFLTISFEECLTECRLKSELACGRCKALPYLRKAASQREWKGEPSTTQLLNGARESYLKIKTDYYINPDDRAFAILGTDSHSVLELFGEGDPHRSEERLRDDICSGQFDFYDGNEQILYDYKTFGSYKVALMLGITSKEEIETDDQGNVVYKKTGKNKGEPKTRKVTVHGDTATRATSILDVSIQMSNYRDKLKMILPEGFTVKKMVVQAICRDQSTLISQQRGITENAPLVPVNGVSIHWVRKYLGRKRDLLINALNNNELPNLCRRRETWDGRKCQKYCEVRDNCLSLMTSDELLKFHGASQNTEEIDKAA